MRCDVESLLQFISLDKTTEEFGFPKNNQSKVVCLCTDCSSEVHLTVLNLKNRFRKQKEETKLVLCEKCIGKRSWTSEKKAKIQKHWENKENREKYSSLTKERFLNNTEFALKHKEACLLSQSDEWKGLLSLSSRKLWESEEYRNKQSEISKKLWESEEYRNRQLKTEEFKQRQSEVQKQIWKNPEYKLNQSKLQKQVWENPEYRSSQSDLQKQVWKNPDKRQKQSDLQKQVWKNPEYRKHLELSFWSNPEYKNKLSGVMRERLKDSVEKLKKASKIRWENPEYRSKITESVKKLWCDPTYRKDHSERSKKLWENKEYIEKMGLARSLQSGRKSSIEQITENILKSIEVNFTTQFCVGHYLFDFFLPDYDVFIECQGEYWHSLPGRQSRDVAKFSYLEKSRPSSKILYLQEVDFLNPNLVSNKIKNFVSKSPETVKLKDFDFSQVKIGVIDSKVSSGFLNSFHYAGFGRSQKISFGAFILDELIAVCKFSTVIREEVASSMGKLAKETMELDRFCIHPSFHKKNFASWFLSKSTKKFFNSFDKISCLVSFADLTYGHFGVIYKASNWKKLGVVKPDYCYVNDEGFILHKKTLYNRAVKMKMKEKEYAELHKYKKVFGKEKIKFILNRSIKS